MLFTSSVFAKLKPHQDVNYYLDLQLKVFKIQDNNNYLLGGIIGKKFLKNTSIGLFIFVNSQRSENLFISNFMYLAHYEGLAIDYSRTIVESFSYSLRLLLGTGIADITSDGDNIVGICTCGIGVVEPIAKLNYKISSMSLLGAELNLPNIIHDGNQTTTGIGISFSYGINW